MARLIILRITFVLAAFSAFGPMFLGRLNPTGNPVADAVSYNAAWIILCLSSIGCSLQQRERAP